MSRNSWADAPPRPQILGIEPPPGHSGDPWDCATGQRLARCFRRQGQVAELRQAFHLNDLYATIPRQMHDVAVRRFRNGWTWRADVVVLMGRPVVEAFAEAYRIPPSLLRHYRFRAVWVWSDNGRKRLIVAVIPHLSPSNSAFRGWYSDWRVGRTLRRAVRLARDYAAEQAARAPK